MTPIQELKRTLETETNPEEIANIQRTIKEIEENKPIELPTQTLEEWEKEINN